MRRFISDYVHALALVERKPNRLNTESDIYVNEKHEAIERHST
jgi:hypothetical protein